MPSPTAVGDGITLSNNVRGEHYYSESLEEQTPITPSDISVIYHSQSLRRQTSITPSHLPLANDSQSLEEQTSITRGDFPAENHSQSLRVGWILQL